LEFLAGLPEPKPRIRIAPANVRYGAVKEFTNTLRTLVDQWVLSGKVQGEQPWERNVKWSSGAYPKTIFDTLKEFRERNPPRVITMDNGRSDVGLVINSLLEWSSPAPDIRDIFLRAHDHAVSWLVSLLDSPTRERFFRCDQCENYFVLARSPKKDLPIKRGTFCKNCKNKGGAKRAKLCRDLKTEKRIHMAADAWVKWEPARRNRIRTEWVASQVSAKLPHGEPIRRNWVTRHQKEIEAEVERRTHAKS
jgi:hypothetical protein